MTNFIHLMWGFCPRSREWQKRWGRASGYVIAQQLGASREHMDRLKLWSDVSVESVSPVLTSEREVEIAEILTDMQRNLAAEIERVRVTPMIR